MYAGFKRDLIGLEENIHKLQADAVSYWNTGERKMAMMIKKDALALMKFHDHVIDGRYAAALKVLLTRDSAVRDEVPAHLWDTVMRAVHGGEQGKYLIHGW